jgi:hypothetical protein
LTLLLHCRRPEARKREAVYGGQRHAV